MRITELKNPVAEHFNLFKYNPSTLRYIEIEHVKTPRRGRDINNISLKTEAYIFTHNTLLLKDLNLFCGCL